MAIKFVVFAVLVAAVKAGVVAPVGPVVAAKVVDTQYDPNPQYTYAYDVQDSLTGDSKNQFETRNGDVVSGRYSLIEADGTRRIVDYTADPINGFNAVVQREPAVVKAAVVAPAVAKIVAPAPVVAHAPVVAPAPVAFARYATPVAAPYARYAAPVPVPTLAKLAAPFTTAPFAARVAAPLSYPFAAPVAKFAAPLTYPAPLAYSAPIASPFAKVVSPFGYASPYTVL